MDFWSYRDKMPVKSKAVKIYNKSGLMSTFFALPLTKKASRKFPQLLQCVRQSCHPTLGKTGQFKDD